MTPLDQLALLFARHEAERSTIALLRGGEVSGVRQMGPFTGLWIDFGNKALIQRWLIAVSLARVAAETQADARVEVLQVCVIASQLQAFASTVSTKGRSA